MYWFAGGDRRAYWTVDFLRKKGVPVHCFNVPGMEDETLPEEIPVLMLPFPIPERWEGFDEIKNRIPNDGIAIGGCFRGYRKGLEDRGVRVLEMQNREPMALLNAVATVEGALALLIQGSDLTLWESKTLVIGGGRIGMLLGERLRDLGSAVTVAVRSSADRGKVRSRGMLWEETRVYHRGLEDYDFVVNTVPAPVLDGDQLGRLKKDCVLLELASAPGGFIPAFCEALGLKAIYGPGLPGKFSPRTAGILYGESLLEVLKEEGVL